MEPGHLDVAIKTELGHTNTISYWSMNLKMNVDYKTALIQGQPILDCMMSYLIWVSGHQAITSNPKAIVGGDHIFINRSVVPKYYRVT